MKGTFGYAVLGAGMQGCAAGFDLALHGDGDDVLFLDHDLKLATSAAGRVNRLVGRNIARGVAVDAMDEDALSAALAGRHGVLSAVPYGLNPTAARAAIRAKACFNDLGGNTAIVRSELALDGAARAAGVSIVPDCGLAPGLGNILAAYLISSMDEPDEVHIRCGGLPQRPRPPLGYKLVFNIGGLTNEYLGEAEYLRGGEIVHVPTLTEAETLTFPAPVGSAEAFVTSGGTSTAPESFRGRLRTYDYKTVRYPGHLEKVRTMVDLGLLGLDPVLVRGQAVIPRDVFHAVVAPRLTFADDRDLVVLRVTGSGLDRGKPGTRQIDLLDFHDEETGFTAMERTTAYSAAAVLHFQVRGLVPFGAVPAERALPLRDYVDAVCSRGLRLVETAW